MRRTQRLQQLHRRLSFGLIVICASSMLGIACTKKNAPQTAIVAPPGAAPNAPAPAAAQAEGPRAPMSPRTAAPNVFIPPGGFLMGVAPGNTYIVAGSPVGKTFQDAMEDEIKPGMTLAQLAERANAVVAEVGLDFGVGIYSTMDSTYANMQETNPAKKNSNIVVGPVQINPCNRKVVPMRVVNIKETTATVVTSMGKFEVKFNEDVRPRMMYLYQGDKQITQMPISDLDHPINFMNGTTPYSPMPLSAKYKEWWDKNMLAKIREMNSGLAETPHLMMTINSAGQIRFASDINAYRPGSFASNPNPAKTQGKPGSIMHTVLSGNLTVDITDYCVQPPPQAPPPPRGS